jgi:sugar transferase (PEP-CTERM/EpsH1 system associated)
VKALKRYRRVHILHIQESLEVGGLENGVVNVANGLDPDLFRSTICCLNRLGPLAERLTNPEASCFSLDQREGKRILLPLRLGALIRRLDVDVVHTHNFYSGLYGIPAARLAGRGVRVVHGEHGMFQHEPRRRQLLGRVAYPFADRVIAVARDQEAILRDLGVPAEKLLTIFNGVDLDRFQPSEEALAHRHEVGCADAKAVIGCVGRLSEEKGHRYLIEAFQGISRAWAGVHLVIVGDGPLRKDLERYASGLACADRVHFTGRRQDVHEIYPMFDVFVLPSLSEGLPNAVLEAMACGRPVVATDVGGTREILDTRTALMVPPGSAARLADAIVRLLEDSVLRRQLGEALRVHVEEHWSLKRMVEDYSRVYSELASSRRRALEPLCAG